jgi:drug/metabolite transporter (DMT)-like permease
VALLAVPLLKERLGWAHGVAIGLLVVGQLGIVGGFPSGLGSGEAMILAATLMWSVEVVVAKRVLAGVSSWTVGVARMGLGSVVLVGWLVVQGEASALVSMTQPQLGWVLLTGLILAAYVGTWFAALARAQAVDVTAVLVLAALVTAALSAVRTGQVVAGDLVWLAMLGAGGAVLATYVWRQEPVVVQRA